MLVESLALALNAVLERQPAACALLARHADKPIRLALPLSAPLLQISPQGRFEPAERDAEPALTLTPDLSALPKWLAGGKLAELFRVEGDGALAADLAQTLQGFDWVLALRPYLGDMAAARVDQFLNIALNWREQALTAAGRNLAEYAVHEAGVLVDAPAVHGFVAEVDRLREDLDRIEARMALLETPRAD